MLKIQDDVSLVRLELDRHSVNIGGPLILESLDDDLTHDLNCMEALLQCAKHQNRIVDDVLQLGKLSMNLISIRNTPFDPLIDAKTCIQRFRAEASGKQIDLNVSATEDYERLRVRRVSGDPIRFAQVLLNLLSNAIRCTETGTIDVVLDASVEEPIFSLQPSVLPPTWYPQGLFLITSVTDSGVGMRTEDLSELVETLDRASPKTYVEYGGSGLGLFISKTLVEAHGGRISIESEKNKGTKVIFYISVEKLSGSMTSTPTGVPHTSTSSPASKVAHVLIVEDNLVSVAIVRI
jgi:signal transduction histidine kinase